MSEERLQRIAELKLRRYEKAPIKERIRIFSGAIADNDLELLRGCFEVAGFPCDLDYFDTWGYPAKDIIYWVLQPVKADVWEIFLEFGIQFPENAILQAAIGNEPDIEGIRFLLDHGASGLNEALLSPFIVGGGRNKVVLEFLLRSGATPNFANNLGVTPLMVSANYWPFSRESIRLLLEFGADVNAVDKLGQTALQHARGDAPAIQKIFNQYARP